MKSGTFEDVWKIIGLLDGIVISHSPFMATGVAYFPAAFMKPEELREQDVNEFLRSFYTVPPGTLVNVYLSKYFDDAALYPSQQSIYPLMNYLEKRRFDKLNSFRAASYGTFISISVPIDVKSRSKMKKRSDPGKIFKNIIKGSGTSTDMLSDVLENVEHAESFRYTIDLLNNLFDQISKKFGGHSYKLGSDELSMFLSLILNHTTSRPVGDLSSVLSSDVVCSPNEKTVLYGGKYHATLSVRTKDLPENADINFSNIYFDEGLLDIPYTVQATVRFPDALKARAEAQIVVNRIDAVGATFAPFRKMYAARKEMMDTAIAALDHYSGRIVDVTYTVHTWADDKASLKKNVTSLQNALKGKEMTLRQDDYNLRAAWHAQVPFCSHLNVLNTRLTSMNAEALMPLLYPSVYINEKPPEQPNHFYNRFDARVQFDLMDRRCSVWNGVITGQSGSGKSFLANQLILNALTYNTNVFIIDKGGEGAGSFRNIVLNLDGTYIELSFGGKMEFSVNPFDGALFFKIDTIMMGDVETEKRIPSMDGVVSAEKIAFLISMLTLMISDNEDDRLSKSDEELLQQLIELAYLDSKNNEGNVLTVTNFANNYLLDWKTMLPRTKNLPAEIVKERCPYFFSQMSKFINSGVYAGFFQKTVKPKNTRLFCFDLEGIDQHPDLKSILSMIIMNYCYEITMDGNPAQRKMIVIDEAWALLRGGKMTAMIEGIWRTIRKHGGSVYCITQDFESIMKSPAGDGIIRNSTYFFMAGSNYNYDTVAQIKATGKSGANAITPYDYKQICTQRFVPPDYSEFYLFTPVFKGTLRFRASSHDYYFSTTDAKDKAKLRKIMDELGVNYVTPEVLERAVG